MSMKVLILVIDSTSTVHLSTLSPEVLVNGACSVPVAQGSQFRWGPSFIVITTTLFRKYLR